MRAWEPAEKAALVTAEEVRAPVSEARAKAEEARAKAEEARAKAEEVTEAGALKLW